MNTVLNKLKSIIFELEREHGSIYIFALFLRVDPIERWDVVLSAPWLNPDELSSYELITSKIQIALDPSEQVQLARIVILDPSDLNVSFLQNLATVVNGKTDEVPEDLLSEKFRFTIKRAYLLRCQTDKDIQRKKIFKFRRLLVISEEFFFKHNQI